MKTIFALITFLFFTGSSYAQETLGVTKTLSSEEIIDPPPPSGPNLHLENDAIHFKSIALGETKKGTLNLFNTGRAPLTINNMSSTCTCVTLNISKKLLDVGDMTPLEYSFTPTEKGSFKETIYLGSNTSPEVTIIEVRGIVE